MQQILQYTEQGNRFILELGLDKIWINTAYNLVNYIILFVPGILIIESN